MITNKTANKKINVVLELAQWRELRHRSIEAGRSASALAREAIDRYLIDDRKANASKHQATTPQ